MKNPNHQAGFIPILIVIIIAVAAAIGGGVYYSNKKADVRVDANIEATTTTDTTSSTSAKTDIDVSAGAKANVSLRSLLARGGSQKCTVSASTANGGTSGTVYMSGAMMRGDFQSSVSGSAAVESHMIMTGTDTYVWSGSQGAKMSVDAVTGAQASAQTKSAIDLDQSGDYKCVSWAKSDAQFAVPSTVNFVDLSAMMKGSIPSIPSAY